MLQHRQLFEMSLANWKSERASRTECYSFSLFAKNEIRKQFCKFTEDQRKKFFLLCSSGLWVITKAGKFCADSRKQRQIPRKKITRIVHKISKVMQNTFKYVLHTFAIVVWPFGGVLGAWGRVGKIEPILAETHLRLGIHT